MPGLREALQRLPDTVFADLLESDDAYLLRFDLPGTTRETVDVTVENGRLRIEARREKEVPTEFRYRTENRSLFLDTELPLPPDAAEGDAEAAVERGVLEVRIPKRAGDEARTIPVEETEE